ncbi:hypothetical protein [Methylobacterium sp. A54F]
MTNAEIEKIAHRILAPSLGRRRLDRIEVRVEEDGLETTALFIDAFMKPNVNPLGGLVASNALHELSHALLEAGEVRFPYLRLRYAEEERSGAA